MMFSLVTFTLLVSAAAAGGTNRTIDDEFGDSVTGLSPLYLLSATAGWGYGPTCIICKVKPEASGCYNGSWHDATASPGELAGVSLSFNGTAIYIYGLVPNTVAGADTATAVNLTFTLDGKPAGTFFHAPDATNDIAYNVSLFAQAGFENGAHELVAMATPGPSTSSLMLFDYAVYTYEDFVASESSSSSGTTSASSSSTSSTSPSSSSTTAAPQGNSGGVTRGAVGGGLVALTALLALMF